MTSSVRLAALDEIRYEDIIKESELASIQGNKNKNDSV